MNPPFTLSYILPPYPTSNSFLIAPDLMLVDNANVANLLIPNATVQSSVTCGISRLASDHLAISQAHENTAESITPASSNSEPKSLNPASELGSFPANALNVNPLYTALNYMNMTAQNLQMATIEASLLNGKNF